jgi:hypothetical protein
MSIIAAVYYQPTRISLVWDGNNHPNNVNDQDDTTIGIHDQIHPKKALGIAIHKDKPGIGKDPKEVS